MVIYTLWFLVIFVLYETNCQDFFTSTSSTLGLLQAEKKVIDLLTNYIEEAKKNLVFLQRYVDRYHELYKNAGDIDGAERMRNPVDNYLLLKRTTNDLDQVRFILKSDAPRYLAFTLDNMQKDKQLPLDEDLQGAALGLLRLQHTYHLDPVALANGSFENGVLNFTPNGTNIPQLTARDCLFLGQHLANQNQFDKALVWYETGLNKSQTENKDLVESLSSEEVQSYITEAKYLVKMQNYIADTTENDDDDDVMMTDMISSENFAPQLYEEAYDWQLQTEQFKRLCRGERLRPLSWDTNLSCRYFRGHHPFYWLQPLKLEIMSGFPFLVVIYDLINEKEISILQELASPNLFRSLHYGEEDGNFKSSLGRTSNNAWIESDKHIVLQRISKKAEMVLGLDANETTGGSEMFQVTNYGIGGLYIPHHDYVQVLNDNGTFTINRKDDEKVGDRIGTLMYYLTDVQAGGATVFPNIGISVWPKKGSAVFWWNLKANGRGDPLTYHGGCPVLYGIKWVTNKWFRSNQQMFLKKCGLDPNEYYLTL